MKKIHVLLLALFAVSAFGAVLATSASAETTLLAEWLANSKAVVAKLATEIKGHILLEDTKTIAGAAAVICGGTLDGTVGPNGEDEITEVLNVAGEKVGELGGLALLGINNMGPDCVTQTLCAAGTEASPIEVWPVGLPWKSRLFLMENGEILDLISSAKEVGYELLCLVLGINTEDTCTAPDLEFLVLNNATSGDAETPVGAKTTPLALCTQSKAETGVNEATGAEPITLLNGELLTVSSE